MSSNDDLTGFQMALLLAVALDTGPHTTQRLTVRLEVSRSVVIHGLDRLGELGYTERITQSGRRAVVVRITAQGRLYLDKFAESARRANLN